MGIFPVFMIKNWESALSCALLRMCVIFSLSTTCKTPPPLKCSIHFKNMGLNSVASAAEGGGPNNGNVFQKKTHFPLGFLRKSWLGTLSTVHPHMPGTSTVHHNVIGGPVGTWLGAVPSSSIWADGVGGSLHGSSNKPSLNWSRREGSGAEPCQNKGPTGVKCTREHLTMALPPKSTFTYGARIKWQQPT